MKNISHIGVETIETYFVFNTLI